MRKMLRSKKALGLGSCLLILVMAAIGFWQYRAAGAIRIESSKDYLSIETSLAPDPSPAIDSTNDYSGHAISKSSANYYQIDYPASGSKIGIGDASSLVGFKPNLAISTWDGQALFSLIAPATFQDKSQLTSALSGGNVSASNGQWGFVYGPTSPKIGFNDKGGLDVVITAKEKPSSPMQFTFASTTVTPYVQRALTAEYATGWSDAFKADIKVTDTQVVRVKDGVVLVQRPDYVVNSVAFYADNKSGDMSARGGKNYRTGKVGQLYRMKAVDSKGNFAWMDWTMPSITTISLTDTTGFLQTGAYPIVIQPAGDTFGYTSVGSSYMGVDTGTWEGSLFTAPASGTCYSISVYARNYVSSDTPQVKGVLATHSNLNIVANGVTNPLNSGNNMPFDWLTCAFGTAPSISASDYVIGFIPYYYHDVKYDAGSTNQGHEDLNNSFASPTNPTGATHSTQKLSIYLTYTAGSGSSISNTPSSYTFNTVGTGSITPTGLNYFSVTNNSQSAVKITIGGTDITGGATRTLSDTATPGSATAGMKAGLNDVPYSYNIVIRKTAPFNTLVSSLGSNGSQAWGLQLLAPTNYTDDVQKAGTVTLTASAP